MRARNLGFSGKSAVHPDQVNVINEAFNPTEAEVEWANRVLEAFAANDGNPTQLPDGEFVDVPIAERARHLLDGAK